MKPPPLCFKVHVTITNPGDEGQEFTCKIFERPIGKLPYTYKGSGRTLGEAAEQLWGSYRKVYGRCFEKTPAKSPNNS